MKTLVHITAMISLILQLIFIQDDSYEMMIEYDMYLNFGERDLSKCTLIYSSDQAIFTTKRYYDHSNDVHQADESTVNFSFNVVDTTTYFMHTDLRNRKIFEMVKILGESNDYLVEEDMLQINWEITKETKMINSYKSYKAKGYFRGRNYEVWFTPEIPTYFGPHKFHGLPGLILSLKDSLNEVEIYATKISKKSNFRSYEKTDFIVISRDEYLKKTEAFIEEIGKSLGTRMGRGLKVKVNRPKIRAIEIYEEN